MKIKKFLFPLLFAPLMLGFSGKNSVKTEEFVVKTPSFSVVVRQNDEHPFLDSWASFREAYPDVCDVTRSEFSQIYSLYLELSDAEKAYVNARPDNPEEPEGYTIGQVMHTLITRLYPNQNKMREEKQKLDQSSIIVIATVVALVGATAISVLYILKNNKVIK